MIENTDDDGSLERAMILMRVVEKQPRVFRKWSDLKERFFIPGMPDVKADPFYGINDAFTTINGAFSD